MMTRDMGSVYHIPEHHPRLQVLGNVTVCHPLARIGDIEEDIDILASRDQYRIFPDEIGLWYAIAVEYQKLLAVEMHRVLHRVSRVGVVRDPDLDDIAHFELPVDVHIFLAG